MEEFENEYDKGFYWVIFFIGLLVIGLLGHYFVFGYSKEEKNNSVIVDEEQEIDLNSYKGVWQWFLGEDDDYPVQELCISYINGNIISFDYFLKDGYKFENQTAELVSDSDSMYALFEIKDDVEGNIFGKISFKNNKVFLAITSSDIEDITTGTIVFDVRVEESLLD